MTENLGPTLEDLIDLEDAIEELQQVTTLLVNANTSIIDALEQIQGAIANVHRRIDKIDGD